MDEIGHKVSPPLYLVGKKIDCWKCGARMPAVALVAPNVEGVVALSFEDAHDGEVEIEGEKVYTLSYITSLPQEVLQYLQKRVPTFKLKYSKMADYKYYVNTCPSCDILSGDCHLHSESGAFFFPPDENEAATLYLNEIPIKFPVYIEAMFCVGAGDLIVRYAQRIE